MSDTMKEVLFDLYCRECTHADLGEDSDICSECLEVPAREYSHRPIRFEQKSKGCKRYGGPLEK